MMGDENFAWKALYASISGLKAFSRREKSDAPTSDVLVVSSDLFTDFTEYAQCVRLT